MTRSETDEIIANVGPERVIAALLPYVSETRRQRIDEVLSGRMLGVHVAVEEPYDPHNAAAVVRSAEALGAGGVHVINAHERVLTAPRTTQGAFHWIERESHVDVHGFVSSLSDRGFRVIGAAMDGELLLSSIPATERVCLLFGNESRGLSSAARDACHALYRIPMFGFSESLNLSVSAAVSLHDLLTRRRVELGSDSDLSAEQWRVERARYYLHSVDSRFARNLGLFVDANFSATGSV